MQKLLFTLLFNQSEVNKESIYIKFGTTAVLVWHHQTFCFVNDAVVVELVNYGTRRVSFLICFYRRHITILLNLGASNVGAVRK